MVISSALQSRRSRHVPLLWAIIGALCISLLFYVVQALGMRSWSAPYYFFLAKWHLITPLVILFSLQIGLWSAMRAHTKRTERMVAASGGVSTGAMAACCMHNFVGLLPIIGLSGVAVFFSTYQTYVFLASIAFSVLGFVYMWRKYRAHVTCNI